MSDTAGRNPPVMPPGRELNVLVAKKVLGLTVTHVYGVPWLGGRIPRPIPDYSTEWDAMRLVVERLVALGYFVQIEIDKDGANCVIVRDPDPDIEPCDEVVFTKRGAEAPHAVSLAALAALRAVEANHG